MSKSKFLEILEKREEKKVKLQEKLQEITGMQWYISSGSADLNFKDWREFGLLFNIRVFTGVGNLFTLKKQESFLSLETVEP